MFALSNAKGGFAALILAQEFLQQTAYIRWLFQMNPMRAAVDEFQFSAVAIAKTLSGKFAT
jgi:hypothetical protein